MVPQDPRDELVVKHTIERDTEDARYDGLFIGECIRIDDPDKRGRIQVVVGGIYDNGSPWVEPLGQMRGVKDGVYWVPEIGSNVAIWLHQGDVDFPYYQVAQFGAPQGESDVPEEGRDVNKYVLRWRDFYIQIDGTENSEKLTIQDLVTQTKLEIERANGGDMTTDVKHDRVETVLNDKLTTVEQGDEIHTVAQGKRTTTIQQNDEKTIAVGDEVITLSAGNRLDTITLGNEVRSVPVGSITQSAGLNIAISAGAAVSLNAGTSLSLFASGATNIQSTGASSMISGGLRTTSFLGGIADTIVGGIVRSITGAFVQTVIGVSTWTFSGLATWTFSGAALFLGSAISIGNSPYRRLVNEDVFLLWANIHTHAGNGLPPTQRVLVGAVPPDIDIALVTTSDLTAS